MHALHAKDMCVGETPMHIMIPWNSIPSMKFNPFHIQISVIPVIPAIQLRMLYKTVEAGEIVSYTPQDYQPWRHSLCFSCALSLLSPRPNRRMMTTLAFLLKQSKNKWDCGHPPWLVFKRKLAKKSASLPHTAMIPPRHTFMFVRVNRILKVNHACKQLVGFVIQVHAYIDL